MVSCGFCVIVIYIYCKNNTSIIIVTKYYNNQLCNAVDNILILLKYYLPQNNSRHKICAPDILFKSNYRKIAKTIRCRFYIANFFNNFVLHPYVVIIPKNLYTFCCIKYY